MDDAQTRDRNRDEPLTVRDRPHPVDGVHVDGERMDGVHRERRSLAGVHRDGAHRDGRSLDGVHHHARLLDGVHRDGSGSEGAGSDGAGSDGGGRHALDAAALQRIMATQPVIDQAKGMLMGYYGIDADHAFALLSRWSSDRHMKVRDLCRGLVRAAAVPHPEPFGALRGLLDDHPTR